MSLVREFEGLKTPHLSPLSDTDMPEADEHRHRHLRSFGRRRSRKLTERQAALLGDGLEHLAIDMARPALTDPRQLFTPPVRAVWLEVGFGGGEHLLWQAEHNPDVGLVGSEPFIDGVVKVIDGSISGNLTNVRVHADDARDLVAWLPPQSIERAFILFPDPWPKKRHQKRRLVSPAFISQLDRIMMPEAELRLATDVADYARAMLLTLKQQGSWQWLARRPADWRQRPADWPPTRYESKAKREGRSCYFLRFRKAI